MAPTVNANRHPFAAPEGIPLVELRTAAPAAAASKTMAVARNQSINTVVVIAVSDVARGVTR